MNRVLIPFQMKIVKQGFVASAAGPQNQVEESDDFIARDIAAFVSVMHGLPEILSALG